MLAFNLTEFLGGLEVKSTCVTNATDIDEANVSMNRGGFADNKIDCGSNQEHDQSANVRSISLNY